MPLYSTDAIATRARSLDFTALGLWLPNPDPILKALGKDVMVYRDLMADSHVGACVRRRKGAVQALEWGLDRDQAKSRVAKGVQAMLDGLDMQRLVGQCINAALFGYQPLEVMWRKDGGSIVPADIEARPPEWFHFDSENQLRFRTRQSPSLGEDLTQYPRKFLLPRQDHTYQNPYGIADLSLCYWPVVFKKGSKKFWLSFAEKFGSAFSVGKLPRNSTPAERAELLDSLERLVQDGVTTIPDDGSVELLEMAGKSASSDLYQSLVKDCRSEITIALLGQDQTTEASANKASATAGLEVTHELRDADGKMIAASINQLIRWIVDVNFGEGTPVPVFSFWDQESQDKLQAQRDKSNHEAGATFTNAYWARAYGYQPGDLATSAPTTLQAAPNSSAVAFAEGDAALNNPIQPELQTLELAGVDAWGALVAQIGDLVAKASSLDEVQQALLQGYGSLDEAELVRVMEAAYALAQLKGLDDVANAGAGSGNVRV